MNELNVNELNVMNVTVHVESFRDDIAYNIKGIFNDGFKNFAINIGVDFIEDKEELKRVVFEQLRMHLSLINKSSAVLINKVKISFLDVEMLYVTETIIVDLK